MPTVNWWGLRNALNLYRNYCVGGDRESNNCAHYLSNSFIKVGFDDLTRNNRHINARCSGNFSSYYQRRPIRARDMRSWFNSKTSIPIKASSWTELIVKMKATRKSYFAIFQYGGGYWGGHVLIYAVNQNRFAGTGNYTDWPKQEAYSFD